MNDRPSWDNYFFTLAKDAARRSSCPRTSCGVVIVDPVDHGFIVSGYNGAPSKQPDCLEVGCLLVDNHCQRALHAEYNAINFAEQRKLLPFLKEAILYIWMSDITPSGTLGVCKEKCQPLLDKFGITTVKLSLWDSLTQFEYGNLFKIPADFRGITSNGTIKKNGQGVMGRGVALQAKRLVPSIENQLGKILKNKGNVVSLLDKETGFFTLPVKHNWWEKADPNLIRESLSKLNQIAKEHSTERFVIPLPGAGNGGLTKLESLRLLQEANLVNNVVVILQKT